MGRCVQCESLYIINYQDVAAEKAPNKKGVPYLTPERHQLNPDQPSFIDLVLAIFLKDGRS